MHTSRSSRVLSRVLSRALSLGLATTLTLAMLGGIDHLAQRDEAAPQWAQNNSPRA